MKLAVNYSSAAADLFRNGQIQLDLFKCPAWPDVIAQAQQILPTYVHFSLKVGLGINDAIDTETNQPADWNSVETILTQTHTPYINLHLSPTTQDYPDIPIDTTDPVHVDMLTERIVQDVCAVVKRFGAERVIVENDHDSGSVHLRAAYLPRVISRVADEANCGFLFDLSHSRLAARDLGVEVKEYIRTLPLYRLRELHLTGIQCFDERWTNRLHQARIASSTLHRFEGRWLDHLPMTDEDWIYCAWAMEQVRNDEWRTPWVVALEYGGVGPLWEAVTETQVLAEQIPRLHKIVRTSAGDAAEQAPAPDRFARD